MLNLHPSYKTPSSWRILFWSGGHPRKFSCMVKLRGLVVPVERCQKGIIIQWRQINHRFYYVRPVILDKKRGYNGRIFP